MVRDGDLHEVAVGDVVLDDVLDVGAGSEIVVDGEVLASRGLEVDESLLTGESDAVEKSPADEVLSGSFVAAGAGRYRATKVGAEAYAVQLAEDARRFTLTRSELRSGIDTILTYVTWAIVPTAALLFVSQMRARDDWREAMSGAVAGTVAMVPEGLVLLTSLAFAVAVVRLAKRTGARAGAARRRGPRAHRRALHRQDRHPHRGQARRAAGRAARRRRGRHRDGARRSGCRGPLAQRHDERDRRALPRRPGMAGHRWRAVLVVAEVERLGVRGTWRVVPRRPRRDARGGRRGRRAARPGAWARRSRPPRAARGPRAGAHRRAASTRPRAGRPRGARRSTASRRRRHAPLLQGAGRHREGDLGRRPPHGRGDRRSARARRRRRRRSMPASSPRSRASWPRCSSRTRCSAGSRPSRSGRWCRPCSRAGTRSR